MYSWFIGPANKQPCAAHVVGSFCLPVCGGGGGRYFLLLTGGWTWGQLVGGSNLFPICTCFERPLMELVVNGFLGVFLFNWNLIWSSDGKCVCFSDIVTGYFQRWKFLIYFHWTFPKIETNHYNLYSFQWIVYSSCSNFTELSEAAYYLSSLHKLPRLLVRSWAVPNFGRLPALPLLQYSSSSSSRKLHQIAAQKYVKTSGLRAVSLRRLSGASTWLHVTLARRGRVEKFAQHSIFRKIFTMRACVGGVVRQFCNQCHTSRHELAAVCVRS